MTIKVRKTHYGTARIVGSCVADRTANVESNLSHEQVSASRAAAFDTQVDVRIVSYRTRLTDADGCSGKAAIDGLVHAGIIADDSPKEVREVSYSQVKVKNKSQERTVIRIERVHDV